MTHCVALIPARYGSTRLPAKALLKDTGKYLIQHVYERVSMAAKVADLCVATDDRRIVDAVEEFGGRAVLTSPDHPSGTDRVAEAVAGFDAGIILNVQGDEPEIDPRLLDRLVARLEEEDSTSLCTAATPIRELAQYEDPDTVKVVIDEQGRALYFSRAPVPHGLGTGSGPAPLKHIGVYAFRREALLACCSFEPAPIEKAERLEQLRWLYNGMKIEVIVTEHDSQGIDTPEDYAAFVKKLAGERS